MSIFLRSMTGFRFVLTGVMLVTVSACASKKKEKLAYVERPAELIYNQALDELDREDWADAKLLFQEVERQHPFSKWARRSMLMSAYASYRTAEHEESIALAHNC